MYTFQLQMAPDPCYPLRNKYEPMKTIFKTIFYYVNTQKKIPGLTDNNKVMCNNFLQFMKLPLVSARKDKGLHKNLPDEQKTYHLQFPHQ